jgi:hypothetical protein
MAPGPSEQFFSEFVAKYNLMPWLLGFSALGVAEASKKIGRCVRTLGRWLGRALSDGLQAYRKLNREFYECRKDCADNRRRFEQSTMRNP